ncbi:TraR/DksA family transcriptional regulator [Flavitalea flava]
MATKKKAAKPAKKPTNVKKIVPAKKVAPKPASPSGSKAGKPSVGQTAKSIAKPVVAVVKKVAHPAPVAKKAAVAIAPAKKPAAAAFKPVVKSPASHATVAAAAKPAAHTVASHVSHTVPGKPPVIKETPKKPLVKTPEKPLAKAPEKPLAKPPEKKEEPKPVPTPPVALKQEPKKIVTPPKPTKVVIPEMKTKTVRKYEPEFTKSVLDTLQEGQTGPTMRYSDSELGEFRELINRKLDAAKKELTYLQGLITRKDEMGGDNDDARYMTMEDGSMSMEREQLSQMASRQITFIDHLEKAIMRIENKTYGICRVTGKLIDKARLRAVPHATLSIEAKQMMNK